MSVRFLLMSMLIKTTVATGARKVRDFLRKVIHVMVQAGILCDIIIFPIFIEENLTDKLHLNMLEEIMITTTLENQFEAPGNLLLLELIYFQQDGALPHTGKARDFQAVEFTETSRFGTFVRRITAV